MIKLYVSLFDEETGIEPAAHGVVVSREIEHLPLGDLQMLIHRYAVECAGQLSNATKTREEK